MLGVRLWIRDRSCHKRSPPLEGGDRGGVLSIRNLPVNLAQPNNHIHSIQLPALFGNFGSPSAIFTSSAATSCNSADGGIVEMMVPVDIGIEINPVRIDHHFCAANPPR